MPFSRCLREIARAWRQGRKEKTSETLVVISHSLLSLRIFIPSASWLGPTPILSPPLLLSERVYSVAHLSACCETIERGRTVALAPKRAERVDHFWVGAGVRCATVQQFKRLAGLAFELGTYSQQLTENKNESINPIPIAPTPDVNECASRTAKCFSTYIVWGLAIIITQITKNNNIG